MEMLDCLGRDTKVSSRTTIAPTIGWRIMRVDQLSYASVYYPLGLSYISDQDKKGRKTLLREVEVDAITLKLQTQGHTITSNTATKPTGQ